VQSRATRRVDTFSGRGLRYEYDDSGWFTHACLLLLLLLWPGAGALFDGHRISIRYSRRKTQTRPQMLLVGLLLFRQQYPSETKG
jgi:hypothetical protein